MSKRLRRIISKTFTATVDKHFDLCEHEHHWLIDYAYMNN